TALPPEIGNIVSLQSLYLTNNQIASLPTEIGGLVNLQYLILRYNRLSGSIMPETSYIANLWDLDLSYNQLSGPIPSTLTNLSNLTILRLNDNPKLFCWETQEALNWALSLYYYKGPSQACRFSFLLPIFGYKGD
ncbi:MAG: hypothetical protein P8074_27985, partial [Anaerolineales bacterium]